jgi:hypothetical protein
MKISKILVLLIGLVLIIGSCTEMDTNVEENLVDLNFVSVNLPGEIQFKHENLKISEIEIDEKSNSATISILASSPTPTFTSRPAAWSIHNSPPDSFNLICDQSDVLPGIIRDQNIRVDSCARGLALVKNSNGPVIRNI